MASKTGMQTLLRQAAPRLARHFFASIECAAQRPSSIASFRNASSTSNARLQYKSQRKTPYLTAFRSQSTGAAVPTPLQAEVSDKIIGDAAAKFTKETAQNARAFPSRTRNTVAYWLLGSAASVFGIVIFGGLTRLTESGLSITEWRPVTGSVPPMDAADWQVEFDKYRASPEFQKLNPNMTLPEFKQIFWMEWGHRLWGRVVGLTTLLPTIYFIARRRVSAPIARNLVLINCLIVCQGFVGWWMVKSGLKDDLFAKNAHPRVSQYRLATHLAMAFTVYTAMVWNGLQILRENALLVKGKPEAASAMLQRLTSSKLRPFRITLAAVAALVATTVMSGAFVAGLDAGLIYNEFPYMGLGLTPPKSELFDPFYSRQPPPHSDLVWRNMLENPSLVQLDHRILAVSSFTAIHALWAYARFSPVVRQGLTQGARRALLGTVGLAWVQVSLGLTTLLYLVPTSIASAHQAGAMALLTGFIVLGSRVWTTPRLARLVRQATAQGKAVQQKVAATNA